MHALNPSMDPQVFADVATAQKPYIQIDDTGHDGLGVMTKGRWQMLSQQLKDLGDIADASVAGGCFQSL